MSEDKKHEIEIEGLKLKSDFKYMKRNFEGVILGYTSTLEMKVKNVGKRTFEGGIAHFNVSEYRETPMIKSSSGGGTVQVKMSEIKIHKSKKFKGRIEFLNNADDIEIKLANIVSKNNIPTVIKGSKLMVPKPSSIEKARSEIFRKVVGIVSLILIVATLGATIGFGLLRP